MKLNIFSRAARWVLDSYDLLAFGNYKATSKPKGPIPFGDFTPYERLNIILPDEAKDFRGVSLVNIPNERDLVQIEVRHNGPPLAFLQHGNVLEMWECEPFYTEGGNIKLSGLISATIT